MTDPTLKASIWVQAQLRMCDIRFIPAMIVKKGDPDAGSVLLKVNRFQKGCAVFSSAFDFEGQRCWMHGLKSGFGQERDADDYIQRQISRDDDIWVLEIEDLKGEYELDAPLLG